MIRVDKEEIWFWYEHVNSYLAVRDNMTMAAYCRNNSLNLTTFTNMHYRMVFKKYTHPVEYQKLLVIGQDYIDSNLPAAKFAKLSGANKGLIDILRTHFNYLQIINDIKIEKGIPLIDAPMAAPFSKSPTMQFQQIPNNIQSQPNSLTYSDNNDDHQVIVQAKNEIELVITKGVRVIVSPEFSTEKLINLINLLKEI